MRKRDSGRKGQRESGKAEKRESGTARKRSLGKPHNSHVICEDFPVTAVIIIGMS